MQVIVLTAEEQKAREAEISQRIAANKEKAATLRKQKEKEWAIKAKQIEAEVEIEKQRKAAEHARAMREQKAKENGSDSNAVIAGIDPVLHKNMVADLRQEISSLKEQLSLNGNMTVGAINDLASSNHARSKRSLDGNRIVETKDQFTSTEDASLLEDRLFDEKLENWEFVEDEARGQLDEVISSYFDSDSGYEESLEDSNDSDSKNSLDTNYVLSALLPQSNSIESKTVQSELADVEQADTNISPAGPQEELARSGKLAALASEDLRFGSKAISKQIRHRLSAREIGSMVAVAAGDEEESQAPSYSVWSSGIFGGSKQKDISNIIGHSSKIHGGTIGGEINLSSDLMFGVSYSRLSSKIKYPSMLDAGSNVSRSNTNIFSVYSGATLAENTNKTYAMSKKVIN